MQSFNAQSPPSHAVTSRPGAPRWFRSRAGAILCASALSGALLGTSCAYTGESDQPIDDTPAVSPVPGAELRNDLILPGETHFKNLWKVTAGGQNAEAYWSFSGDRLSLQAMEKASGIECDRIYVTGANGDMRQVSGGRGVTTCAFFMPDDKSVLYASTHQGHDACPTKPQSEGYTWMLWPDYDIFVSDLATGSERPLIEEYGYDAEATVSPQGDRIVFTSTRSGDLELWTSDLNGQDLFQVTDTLGYDGGAFFNHAGDRLVFRTTAWTPGNEVEEQARYKSDLQRWQIRPNQMEIYTIRPDGSERTQVTSLGGASFAPYFTPDDQRIIFSTNAHTESADGRPGMNFDIFMCDLDGKNMEQVTFLDGEPGRHFDGFPMFSRDGQYLAFSSNRGARVGDPESGEYETAVGETNVYIAEWVD